MGKRSLKLAIPLWLLRELNLKDNIPPKPLIEVAQVDKPATEIAVCAVWATRDEIGRLMWR